MSNSTALIKRKYFKPADLIVVGFVLLAVILSVLLLCFRQGDGRLYAEIRVNGQLVETVDLSAVEESYELSVKDTEVKLLISLDGVCFLESDCPDKLCVNRGVISQSGQSAVCLPAGVSVKITQNTSTSDVDAIAG